MMSQKREGMSRQEIGSDCLWFMIKALTQDALLQSLKCWDLGGFWSVMGKSVMFISPLPQCQSEVQQPGGVSLTSRLKVIGPSCWQEAELLHCGCFNLNIQLSNTSLHRPQVTSSVHLHTIQVPVWRCCGARDYLCEGVMCGYLCEDVVCLAENPAGVGIGGDQQF